MAFSPAAYFPMKQGIALTKQSSGLIASRSLPLRKESTISHQSFLPITKYGTSLSATTGIEFPALNGTAMRIGVITTRWNKDTVQKLKEGTLRGLVDLCNVKKENIVEYEVPGSWELPVAARYMMLTQKVDAVVVIGVLIKGETDHYDMIKDAVTSAIMQLGLETGIPVCCGVMGCHTLEQAEARATGTNNHGVWWGQTAVEMATLRQISMGKGDVAASGAQKKKVLF